MTDPINTQNRLRNTGVSSDTRTGSAAKTNQSATQGKDRSAKSDEASTVELSGAALLEELGEQIKNLPEVNEAWWMRSSRR